MYCKSCGTQIQEGTAFFAQCGTPIIDEEHPNIVQNYQANVIVKEKPQGYVISILALVFGALYYFSFVGLVLGIIGLCENKSNDSGVKIRCIIGIAMCCVWVLILILAIALFSFNISAVTPGI